MALDPSRFPVEEFTLDNGLRVRLLSDRSLPVCSIYSFFRVGSRNERPGLTGISHLFEHMMFNGSSATARRSSIASWRRPAAHRMHIQAMT